MIPNTHRASGRKTYSDFDYTDFWDDDDYAGEKYIESPPSDELMQSIEQEPGYKLPVSYIVLMKLHNGGVPRKNCYPSGGVSSWASDHVSVTGIKGIDRNKNIFAVWGTG